VIKLIKHFGHLLYRIWFYILVGLLIIVFLPLLLVFSFSQKTYPQFYWVARNLWATPILYGMGCPPELYFHGKPKKGQSYMWVANHASMLDIMLMLHISKTPFVFVGKKELASLPLFGFFYKKVCILVDRSDAGSRSRVYRQVQKRLQTGLGICIFPEGGVPEEEVLLDTFKNGAFKIAINHDLPIVPISILDTKSRFSFTFFSGGPGKIRAIVHPSISTDTLSKPDYVFLKTTVRETILKDLEENVI